MSQFITIGSATINLDRVTHIEANTAHTKVEIYYGDDIVEGAVLCLANDNAQLFLAHLATISTNLRNKQKTTQERLDRWMDEVSNIVELAGQVIVEHDMGLPKTDPLDTLKIIYDQGHQLWTDIDETVI